jgi:flagellar protein FliT
VNDADALAVYEQMWALTVRMRDAARESQWDELAALENERYARVKGLMAAPEAPPLSGEQDARKADLIRGILDLDAETRSLTEAWRLELRQILDSVGTEKKLGNAYAAFE